MEETKLTAALPNLDIQIIHREFPEEGAETIAIQFKATPSFDAVLGQFRPMLPMTPFAAAWMAPMQMWSSMVQQAWTPWLSAVGALPRLEKK